MRILQSTNKGVMAKVVIHCGLVESMEKAAGLALGAHLAAS